MLRRKVAPDSPRAERRENARVRSVVCAPLSPAGWTIELAMRRFGMQFQPECIHDLEDGVETGTTLTGERFVKTFTGQAGITRHLCHALGTGDIAQRFCNERRVAVGLLKRSLKISRHFLRGAEMLGNIIASGFGFAHDSLLQVACEAQCSLDVGGLCTLVASSQR